jgi:hypothetical protein
MATQMEALKEYGIRAEVEGGIPYIDEREYERALAIIWLDKVAGWWNYKDDLFKYGICTEEQYTGSLKRSVERHK